MEDNSLEISIEFAQTLKPILKEVINDLAHQPDSSINSETCRTLTEEPPTSDYDVTYPPPNTDSHSPGLQLITGYPSYPLYNRLSNIIAYWMITGNCPVLDLPEMYLLNEQAIVTTRLERIESITPKLKGAYSLWDNWSEDEKKFLFIDIFKCLNIRGILDLLGIRQTVGSAEILPPSKEILLKSFLKPNCLPAKLTVGARALAKHHHRDDSTSWWGKCTGTEDEKNRHALQLVLKIMANATWINIHSLPHDVKVVEMRTLEGYGVRWQLEGYEFRGFLEPQMEDGHAVGWRH